MRNTMKRTMAVLVIALCVVACSDSEQQSQKNYKLTLQQRVWYGTDLQLDLLGEDGSFDSGANCLQWIQYDEVDSLNKVIATEQRLAISNSTCPATGTLPVSKIVKSYVMQAISGTTFNLYQLNEGTNSDALIGQIGPSSANPGDSQLDALCQLGNPALIAASAGNCAVTSKGGKITID